MHTHTFKARRVTGLGFQAMAPLEAIMVWHTARCLLLIHGPISCLHTSAYRCRPAWLQANKLDCVPDICNPALLLTKAGSTLAYVGHLSFITQIPIGSCGWATFEYVTVISAGEFHMWFSRSSDTISTQMRSIYIYIYIMHSEIGLHVRIKMKRDFVRSSDLNDIFRRINMQDQMYCYSLPRLSVTQTTWKHIIVSKLCLCQVGLHQLYQLHYCLHHSNIVNPCWDGRQ